MKHCTNCGSDVMPDFARVFGDNDDEVHACPSCTTMTSIVEGGRAALGSGSGLEASG